MFKDLPALSILSDEARSIIEAALWTEQKAAKRALAAVEKVSGFTDGPERVRWVRANADLLSWTKAVRGY